MKAKVLAIAPYDGLKKIMERVGSGRNDMELTALVGDLSAGAHLAVNAQQQGYQVIVSRGGTANMIERIAHLPVVEIPLSGYDMLRAICMARLHGGRFAIVGFSAIAKCARLVLDLTQEHADVFTIESSEDARDLVRQLGESGFNLIVGDAVTIRCAQEMGIDGILIASGEESVETAFDQAVRLCRTLNQFARENALQSALVDMCCANAAVFDSHGQLVFEHSNDVTLENFPHCLVRYVQNVLQAGNTHFLLHAGEYQVPVTGSAMTIPPERYALFCVHPPVVSSPGDESWISTRAVSESYAPSFGLLDCQSPRMNDFIHQARAFGQHAQPIWIMGEAGTGKDAIANAIFGQFCEKNTALATLDAQFATSRRWDALFNSTNSILCQTCLSIYIKNVQAMESETRLRLVEYLRHSQLHRRNRLFFSMQTVDCHFNDALDDPLYRFLADELECLTLVTPPLRERPEDIPALSSLHINRLNLKYGKQIVGLTSEAIALLQDFSWPHNLSDLQQLLGEAVLLTDTPYITDQTVAHLLKKLRQNVDSSLAESISCHGTLNEITLEIIQLVLKEENNNHSRAAARLGISRGTLWRRLKEMEGIESK